MRLSTKAQYAVRALVDLSMNSAGRPVALKDIARREDIPLNYLEQLFNRLKKGDLVRSVRGPGGGYVLARKGERIPVSEIVTTVEEPLNPVACLDESGSGCSRAARCVTYDLWKELGDTIHKFLSSKTLEDLVREAADKTPGIER
ncbi:Rrf2 family transcriptional regulator [Geobacter sp. DSM 9736]|uniref:Rrf2 family transcriptional regulator n=1 Tax=Geobacter sp. DSM 9736 TaxID=1277350 RepID=UPI000B50E26D|nr:Rrf2 family transcriptional regulator [Geobacter sp. DSM 9736]SNB44857.1 transcriptional regulator, BadM/Rrf2 family [Geobacter sp. DSM 9736]